MTDLLHHFHFQHSALRGELVQLSGSYTALLGTHDYPDIVKRQMGQALAAVALMTSTLKLFGSLILEVKGNGPLSLLMVECNDAGDMRGIAHYDDSLNTTNDITWGDLVGDGHCILTIDPNEGERYQGIVSLSGQSLSEVLTHYFAQSEQLPTRFWLFANETSAAGLLLQVLPGHDHEEKESEDWSRVVTLADTLVASELLGLEANTVLYRLYHDEQVLLLGQHELRFKCSCTRQRSANALRAIGAEELQDIANENGGFIDVNCQFCRNHYRFDAIDLAALHQPIDSSSSSLQ
ncbi:MAG: Hsp33 family molecular chaperone HslO [Moraxellaceae bacterium]|nr:Hsp33 family molecular chaperone HslO [Moraxellaceae bacterium]MDZ4386493.1 Hsp33 family molecular chaperone HslO [Moraxellaceae bacterium]